MTDFKKTVKFNRKAIAPNYAIQDDPGADSVLVSSKLGLKQRLISPVPPFWKKIRNSMIAIGAVSTVIATAPVSLPALVVSVAQYGIVLGSIGTVLSQLTTHTE